MSMACQGGQVHVSRLCPISSWCLEGVLHPPLMDLDTACTTHLVEGLGGGGVSDVHPHALLEVRGGMCSDLDEGVPVCQHCWPSHPVWVAGSLQGG